MEIKKEGEKLTILLSEKLTIYETESFRDEVLTNLTEDISIVKLNGEQIEIIDTLGVQIIFALFRLLKDVSIELEYSFSDILRDKYNFYGFDKGA